MRLCIVIFINKSCLDTMIILCNELVTYLIFAYIDLNFIYFCGYYNYLKTVYVFVLEYTNRKRKNFSHFTSEHNLKPNVSIVHDIDISPTSTTIKIIIHALITFQRDRSLIIEIKCARKTHNSI